MAFPTTTVLDNFNRANLDSLGANWGVDTIGGGSATPAIRSNAWESANGTYVETYWSAATYTDSEAYATVLQVANGSDPSFGLMVRCQTPGSAACDGYRLQIAGSTWDLLEVTNGSEGASMDTASQAIAANDKFGLEIIGSTIKAYHHNGTSWSEILSASDGTITAAGNIGIWGYNGGGASNAWRFDDFAGGEVVGGGTDYDADPNAAAASAAGPLPSVTTVTRPYTIITIA